MALTSSEMATRLSFGIVHTVVVSLASQMTAWLLTSKLTCVSAYVPATMFAALPVPLVKYKLPVTICTLLLNANCTHIPSDVSRTMDHACHELPDRTTTATLPHVASAAYV